LGLNLALIPAWGARGAAVAALVTQCFVAAAMVWLCLREFRFKSSGWGTAQVAGFTVWALLSDWLLFEKTALPWPAQFP
jgi:hypothetical protein